MSQVFSGSLFFNSNIWQVACNLSIMCLIQGHINFGQFIGLLVHLLLCGRLPTQSSIKTEISGEIRNIPMSLKATQKG